MTSKSERFAADERRWSDLMARAQRGDKVAYARLLTEVGAAIEAFVRHGFGDIEMLEDCVQECLVTLHEARHSYDPTRRFRPWLFTLVRHRTIDLLRRSQRWQGMRDSLGTHPDAASYRTDDLDRAIDGARALARLTPEQHAVVTLVKYAGLTTAEAAIRLGVPESAVKARLRRALKRMFRELHEDHEA